MSLSTLIAVSAQLWLLWYAVRAVTHRNDRRAPCQSSADALLGAAAFAGTYAMAIHTMKGKRR